MVLLTLDEKSTTPKYQQIIHQLRQKIENRVLRPGERLPSTRRLAEKLSIHRSTVSLAYQELWALGYIELRPGSYPTVRKRMNLVSPTVGQTSGTIDWETIVNPVANAIQQDFLDMPKRTQVEKDPGIIYFDNLDMDSRLSPLEYFRTSLNRALKEKGTRLLGYGNRVGYLPLRKYLARHLQGHGISVTPDEILITSGSQQAVDMVFRMLAAPGKTVAIEAPSYDYVLPLLRFYGLKPLEVPITKDGMDLHALTEIIQKDKPALIYTMPNFQNPTGITTSQAHREELLSIAETNGIPILEDGFDEEMKYFGKEVLPIKSMDKQQVVIYCGTFSKVLFPGMRIGWVTAARECIRRLTAIRCFSQVSSSMILQAGIYEFCREGYFDRHIAKMHREFRKRMHTALKALQNHISHRWAQWDEPNGGYLIWLKLEPLKEQPVDWDDLFRTNGIKLTRGNQFFYSHPPDSYLRLSISALNPEEIEEGIKRLAKALAHVYENP